MLSLLLLLSAFGCGWLSAGATAADPASVPSHGECDSFALNGTWSPADFPRLLPQYTGDTIGIGFGASLQLRSVRDAGFLVERNTLFNQKAGYGGRTWQMSYLDARTFTFDVLDDTLSTVNSVPVQTSVPWNNPNRVPYWQTLVDEAASTLYSAGMVDSSMRLDAWRFSVDGSNSTLLFSVALPMPYLVATIYLGAQHTILLTYEDDTSVYRLNGSTGQFITSFDAPGDAPPTALVEAADGSVLYVSADWPNVAAYDVQNRVVLAHYYWSGPSDAQEQYNIFTSLAITGDGQWLFGAAAVSEVTPVMRWRIGYAHYVAAPHVAHHVLFATNYTNVDARVVAQYTGGTVVLQHPNSLQRWQLNNSIYLKSRGLTLYQATSYRGRVWTASILNYALSFSVLDDSLTTVNAWAVNTSVAAQRPVQWSVLVDEEAGLLYSAEQADADMTLSAWQIGPLGNTTAPAFRVKLPTPYLPSTLYAGARHTLLLTYQDDTRIYRLCGYTGALLSVFNASSAVPTAVAESHDGRVLYVNYAWPSMAAYDSATGALLYYYDFADGLARGAPRDVWGSAAISGDGNWLLAYATNQALVVQWRINHTLPLQEQAADKPPAALAEALKMARS